MFITDNPKILCSTEICYSKESCQSLATSLKDLIFSFDNKVFYNVPASEYLIHGNDVDMPEFCVIGIKGEKNSDKIVLGQIFLKSFYTIFDL